MKKPGVRSQKIEVGGQGSLFWILNSVFCILLLTACSSAKKSELPQAQVEAIEYNRRGVDAATAGNYDKAVIEFQKSLKLNTRLDNQNGISVNLLNLGRLYLAADRLDDARPVLERALEIGLNIDDLLIVSEAYASLARYYYLSGKNKDAIDMLEKALIIDRKDGYRTIGIKLNLMGLIYKADKRFEDAERMFSDALKSNKGYGMKADIADSFRGLGDVLAESGDYKKAEEFYENALEIDKRLGISAKISIDLSNMGTLSLKLNDVNKALDFFVRAYEIDNSRGDIKRALKNIDKIIDIYAISGDKDGAAVYSLKRETLLKKEGDKEK